MHELKPQDPHGALQANVKWGQQVRVHAVKPKTEFNSRDLHFWDPHGEKYY